MKIFSVILAAGNSKRMGKDKAFLKYKKSFFLKEIHKKLKKLSDEVIIVTNKKNYEKIKNLFPSSKVILNNKPELGQINSVKIASKYIMKSKEKAAIMINLVDQPLIKPKTYKILLQEFKNNNSKIIIPVIEIKNKEKRIKRGHPIIIPYKYLKLIIKAPYLKGLHWVTHHKNAKIKEIKVKDKGIIKDFDTPHDYKKLKFI